MGSELLALNWNNHQSSFTQAIKSARNNGDYCDVTLVCNEHYYRVHKLVLANCSDYFTHMLHYTENKHPLIVLTDISHEVLETLLDYLYDGQVNVLRSDIPALFKAAASLKIKGLTLVHDEDNASEFPQDYNASEFLQDDNALEFPQVEDNASEGKRAFENDVDVGDSKKQKVEYDPNDELQIPKTQSALGIGSEFASFQELSATLDTYQKDYNVQLWRRVSVTLERARRRAPKQHFDESLNYSYLEYCCIHGGRKHTTKSCPFSIKLKAAKDGHTLRIVNFVNQHKDHDVDKVSFEIDDIGDSKKQKVDYDTDDIPHIPNKQPLSLAIGLKFGSFQDLSTTLDTYQKDHYVQLWRRVSVTLERARRRAPKRHFEDSLHYSYLEYCCIHGDRKHTTKSTGDPANQLPNRQSCPFTIKLKAAKDGKTLRIVNFVDVHKDHDVDKVCYEQLPG